MKSEQQLSNGQQQRCCVKKQIKNIHRPIELAITQHPQLFHQVWFRLEGRQPEKERKREQNYPGNLLEKSGYQFYFLTAVKSVRSDHAQLKEAGKQVKV